RGGDGDVVACRTFDPRLNYDTVEHARGIGGDQRILIDKLHQVIPNAVQRVALDHGVIVRTVLDGNRGDIVGGSAAVHRNDGGCAARSVIDQAFRRFPAARYRK